MGPVEIDIEIGARLYDSTRPPTQVPNQTRDFDFDFDFETGADDALTPLIRLIRPRPGALSFGADQLWFYTDEESPMSTQLLFYANAVPVNSNVHRDLSVKAGDSFAFAAKVNAVPLMTVEFARAAMQYPVVFAGDAEGMLPVAVLGFERDHNLFVGADGRWDGDYVPAFVRRYPFVFASDAAGTNFTLCIDEGFSGCNRDGRGERLFDADGERTQYLSQVLNFTSEYQAQFQRTRAFCDRLRALGVLEPMQAQFTLPGGARPSLTGFLGVNRERLKALADDVLLDLARSDALELIHLHLHSLNAFGAVARRAGAAPAAPGLPDLGADEPPPLVTH